MSTPVTQKNPIVENGSAPVKNLRVGLNMEFKELKMGEILKYVYEVFTGIRTIGKQRAEESLLKQKIIVAQAVKDWVEPYASQGNILPVVIFSTHPEYDTGTRLDLGFLSLSMDQGYSIFILGYNKDD